LKPSIQILEHTNLKSCTISKQTPLAFLLLCLLNLGTLLHAFDEEVIPWELDELKEQTYNLSSLFRAADLVVLVKTGEGSPAASRSGERLIQQAASLFLYDGMSPLDQVFPATVIHYYKGTGSSHFLLPSKDKLIKDSQHPDFDDSYPYFIENQHFFLFLEKSSFGVTLIEGKDPGYFKSDLKLADSKELLQKIQLDQRDSAALELLQECMYWNRAWGVLCSRTLLN